MPIRCCSLLPVLLSALPLAAQQTPSDCHFASLPREAVEAEDFTVKASYKLPPDAPPAKLHCELKDLQHNVFDSQVVLVQGAGQQAFVFQGPARERGKELLVALWLGEDWRQPLAPIIASAPIPILSQEMMALRRQQQAAAPALLQRLGHRRQPGKNVAILSDDLPGLDRSVAETYARGLTDAGLAVTTLHAEALANAYVLNVANFDLLLLTHAPAFPAPALDALGQYLRAGGNLIALGAPAFSKLPFKLEGAWADAADLPTLLGRVQPTHLLFDFEQGDLSGWQRGANDPASPTTFGLDQGAAGTTRALHVAVSNLTGWDTIVSPQLQQPIPQGHALTCLWARGSQTTTQLALEWREKDESRWIATIPLSQQWQHYALRPEDFQYWPDNPSKGRGGPADRLKPANTVQLSVGLAFTHTSLPPGKHEFWVDEIGTAENPYPELPDASQAEPPTLDTLSPAYKIHPVSAGAALRLDPRQALLPLRELPPPQQVLSSHVRPQATGCGKQRQWRWIPLVEAVSPQGDRRGTPGVLLINRADPYSGSLWGSLAVADQGYLQQAPVVDLITALAKRMLDGVFLDEGGAQSHAYFQGEKVNLGAEVINLGAADSGPLTVHIRVSRDREALLDRQFELNVPAGESRTVECPWAPGRFEHDEYDVTVELLRQGTVIDCLGHQIGIWQPKPKPVFMTAHDGDLWLGDQRWYAHGVNYMPSSGIASEDGPYFEYWLDPQPYDPEVIERDLKLIQQMGMNMVSVFIDHRSVGSRNLLDLLRRCEKHGLLVNLSLRPGTPMDFRWPEMRDIIETCHLAENDTVFAYDLAWEPAWGSYESRQRWDPEWARWIVERYGSLGNAEKDWGFPCPRADGNLTSPSDAQVSRDGQWRVMVAAYRRFLDDLLSKRHTQAARLMRSVDPNHLISFRMSIAGDPTVPSATMAYDFRGLAKSMDLMCPEGYGRIGDWERVKEGRFTADYARCMAPGRPVMWAEFGCSVWDMTRLSQNPDRLKFQAQFYRDFYRMLGESHVSGSVCWWFPGGFRVGENSDFGIINPDGTFRETSEVIRDISGAMKALGPRPAPTHWITIDRDASPLGLQGVYQAVQQEYWAAIERGEVPGLRTAGMGTTSANCPLVAVGNTPYNGSNPPKWLNAEFAYVQILDAKGQWQEITDDGATVQVKRGQPIKCRAQVGNTAEAAWLAPGTHPGQQGVVYLSARPGSGLQFRQPIPQDVAWLGDAIIEEFTLTQGITDPTHVAFEMTADARAWFGERLELDLQPVAG